MKLKNASDALEAHKQMAAAATAKAEESSPVGRAKRNAAIKDQAEELSKKATEAEEEAFKPKKHDDLPEHERWLAPVRDGQAFRFAQTAYSDAEFAHQEAPEQAKDLGKDDEAAEHLAKVASHSDKQQNMNDVIQYARLRSDRLWIQQQLKEGKYGNINGHYN